MACGASARDSKGQALSSVTVSGSGSAARDGGTSAGEGGVAVGRDLVVANPEDLWKLLGQSRPTADLSALTQRYLAYLVDRYQFLDFRGMGAPIPLVDEASDR